MLDTLARMLGLSRTQAEESLHSERAARHVLTRRSAMGLAGAMCVGTVLGEVPIAEPTIAYLLTGLTPFQRELVRQMDEAYAKFGEQFAVTVFAPRCSGMSNAMAAYRHYVRIES